MRVHMLLYTASSQLLEIRDRASLEQIAGISLAYICASRDQISILIISDKPFPANLTRSTRAPGFR